LSQLIEHDYNIVSFVSWELEGLTLSFRTPNFQE
jgi:hypothetical protein